MSCGGRTGAAGRPGRAAAFAVAATLAALVAAGARAQTTAPAAQPAEAASAAPPALTADDGRRFFTSYCARCHGINLVVSSSAFFDLRTFPRGDKERFLRSVNKGVRAMPAWEGIVRPDQIEAIWLYIGSVNGWNKP